MSSYARMAEIARKVTLIALALLLLTLALETLWMPRGSRVPYALLFLVVISLPLLILVPGVWRGGLSSCVWLGFVSMLYFAQAVVALLSSQARALDLLQLLFSIALFTGALLFVRWRARAIRGAEAQ
jgi:uncharacterized membrane protein